MNPLYPNEFFWDLQMDMQTPVNSATLNAIDLELFLNPENVYGKRGQNDTFS